MTAFDQLKTLYLYLDLIGFTLNGNWLKLINVA